MVKEELGINTICVNTGDIKDEQFKGAVSPIYMSTSYQFEDVAVKRYPRYFNTPNQEHLSKKNCCFGTYRGSPDFWLWNGSN